MSVPFQPGDVVVCVDDSIPSDAPELKRIVMGRLRKGACHRVLALSVNPYGDVGLILSNLDASPWRHGWAPKRFRKIDEGVTEDFREQLRSLKSPKPTLNPSRHSRERVA